VNRRVGTRAAERRVVGVCASAQPQYIAAGKVGTGGAARQAAGKQEYLGGCEQAREGEPAAGMVWVVAAGRGERRSGSNAAVRPSAHQRPSAAVAYRLLHKASIQRPRPRRKVVWCLTGRIRPVRERPLGRHRTSSAPATPSYPTAVVRPSQCNENATQVGYMVRLVWCGITSSHTS